MLHPAGQRPRGGGPIDALRPIRILFLCTGNSCRSQIAEGWARHLKAGVIDPASAGTRPQGLNPMAVRAMAEAGVDMTRQTSKHIDSLRGQAFDLIITVCDSAREACPTFPGAARTIHIGFEDPPALARPAKTDEEAMAHYRRIRDQIRAFVQTLPDAPTAAATTPTGGERTHP